MRTSILNTATTEQMGYGIISFFCVLASHGMNAIVFGEMGEKSEDYCFLGSSIIPKIIFFNEWDKNAGAFTNLLFVIKTRQLLKQNFRLNCKETMVKKKEWL